MDAIINPFSFQTPEFEIVEFRGGRLPWGALCFVSGDNLDHARALALGAFGLDEIITSEYKFIRDSESPKYKVPFISYTSSIPHAEISRFSPTVHDEIILGLSSFISKSQLNSRSKDVAGIMGISELLDRDPLALSGGETTRVVLAAHLARRPRIWIIDQILGELDPSFRNEFVNYLHDYCMSNSAIVLIIEDLNILPQQIEGHVWHVGKDAVLTNPPLKDVIVDDDFEIPDELSIEPSSYGAALEQIRIAVDELCVTRSERKVFDKLTFSFGSGQVCWVFGKNGSGKTTLLESLVGLTAYDDGTVSLYRNGTVDDIISNISYSPQHSDIDITENSLIEEIAFAFHPSWKVGESFRKRAENWLITLGLKKDRISADLSSSLRLKKLASVLSSFARRKAVIALDEPTLFLSHADVKLIARLIFQYVTEGCLIMVATHDKRLIIEMNKMEAAGRF